MNRHFFRPTRSKLGASALVATGLLVLLGVFFAINRPGPAQASGGDLNSAEAKYPLITGTRLDTCGLCHTSSIPQLNPYGAAYKANGRNSAAFGLIENLDSDNDGFTNLQEINALTFPGNPSDHPAGAPAATATQPAATSTATQPPAATATQAPPTATSLPATATSLPATATSLPPTTTSVPPTATAELPTATSQLPSPTPTSSNPYPPPVVSPTSSNPYPPPPAGPPSPTATRPPKPTVVPTLPPRPTPPTPLPPTPSPIPTSPTPAEPGNGIAQLAPEADAYVQASNADTNYGAALSLRAVDDPRQVTYLRFSVPNMSSDRTVTRATLKLFVNSASGSGFTVRRVDDTSWSENQITYANAPMPGEIVTTADRLNTGRWIKVDVTSLFQNGSATANLALVAREGAWNSFASRESGEHAPVLKLYFNGQAEDSED